MKGMRPQPPSKDGKVTPPTPVPAPGRGDQPGRRGAPAAIENRVALAALEGVEE